jgi:hypothetical protein
MRRGPAVLTQTGADPANVHQWLDAEPIAPQRDRGVIAVPPGEGKHAAQQRHGRVALLRQQLDENL